MHASHKHHGIDGQGKPKLRVDAQPYDVVELQLLELSRMFFVSFGQPETQLWMKAFYWAENIYPAPVGATVAQAALRVLNEMRVTRPHTFNYTDPRCAECSVYMTSEERYLMDAIRHTRRKDGAKARLSAMLLCEGNDPAKFMEAVAHLDHTLHHHLILEAA